MTDEAKKDQDFVGSELHGKLIEKEVFYQRGGPSGHPGADGTLYPLDLGRNPSDIGQPQNEYKKIPQSDGIDRPYSYPVAMNPGYDRAYLRPLQQPIFDTEWFVPQKRIKELVFFKNPCYGSKYHFLDEEKTQHDTNLNQSAMLDHPREFSILGFNVIFDAKTEQKDRDALLSNGAQFVFHFSGSRPYLNVPLENVVAKPRSQHSAAHVVANYWTKEELNKPSSNLRTPADQCEKKSSEPKDDLISHAVQLLEKSIGSDFYKFNLGKSALKIKSGEAFYATLSWKKTPYVSKPVKIIVELIGLTWMPL